MTGKPTIPDPWRGGRKPRRFAFTYEDLARLFGVKVSTVIQWAANRTKRPRRFDPSDLRSIIALYEKRRVHVDRLSPCTADKHSKKR